MRGTRWKVSVITTTAYDNFFPFRLPVSGGGIV